MLTRQKSRMFDSVTQFVPPGHEKAVRQALYTAAAIFSLGAVCIGAIYVYLVLQMFIKPLMWALLIGSFLFPFKYSLNSLLKSWIIEQKQRSRPLVVAVTLLPLNVFDSFAESVGNYVKTHKKLLLAIASIFAVLLILHYIQLLHIIEIFIMWSWKCVLFIWKGTSISVDFFAQYRILLITVFGSYVLSAFIVEPATNYWLSFLAVPAWISLVICIVSAAGTFQVPLGIAVAVLIAAGFIAALKQRLQSKDILSALVAGRESLTALLRSSSSLEDSPNIKQASKDISDTPDGGQIDDATATKPTIESRKHGVAQAKHRDSALYFNITFSAFAIVIAWNYTWILVLMMLPLLYYAVKQLFCHHRVITFINYVCLDWFGCSAKNFEIRIYEHCKERKNILFPPAITTAFDSIILMDRKLSGVILDFLPTLTSVFMILALIIGGLSLSFFSVFMVQRESFLLMRMTADVINETVSNHPEYKSWLPDNQDVLKSFDGVIDEVYWQGRDWIKTQLRENLGSQAKLSGIENQSLKIWDQVYDEWFNRSVMEEKKLTKKRTVDSDIGQKSIGLFAKFLDLLDMSEVFDWVRDNISSLRSVVESTFSIIRLNLSLVLSSFNTFFTLVLSGGTAILNFVFSVVVFFTALFYLLAGSDEQYVPTRLIGFADTSDSGRLVNPFMNSLQDAINGVFGASLKMASFYALYTWVNHTSLGSTLVFVPSLLAAIFSVVPIVATYWSCFPAVLELWIIQGSFLRGVFLLFLQFLPTMFVDGSIYQEMADSGSGHPYVTGLSVIGGLYYFGLEGAIIGPILLCVLLVVINAYFRIINMPETIGERDLPMPSLNLRKSSSDDSSE